MSEALGYETRNPFFGAWKSRCGAIIRTAPSAKLEINRDGAEIVRSAMLGPVGTRPRGKAMVAN